MSFGQELKDFVSAFSAGYKMFNDADYKNKLGKYYDAMAEKASNGDDEENELAKRMRQVHERVTGGGRGGAGRDGNGDEAVADDSMEPEQKALLHSIYGTESPGYNVMYGGKRFASFDDHPRVYTPIQSGPNQGKKSSAAGRPQFLADTWDKVAAKHGFEDFSPINQDRGAWSLANDTYKAKTGRDLLADLKQGGGAAAARAGQVLRGVWTSLPGGLEEGTTVPRFQSAYERYYNRYSGAKPAQPGATARVKPARVPVSQYQNTAAIDDSDLGYEGEEPTFSARNGGPITGRMGNRSSYMRDGKLIIPPDDEDGAPADEENDFQGTNFPERPTPPQAERPYRVPYRGGNPDDPMEPGGYRGSGGGTPDPMEPDMYRGSGSGTPDPMEPNMYRGSGGGTADPMEPAGYRHMAVDDPMEPDAYRRASDADAMEPDAYPRSRVSAGKGPGGAGARPTGPAPKRAAVDTEGPDDEETVAPSKPAARPAAKAAPKAVDPQAAPTGDAPALQPGETLYTDPKSGKRYAIPDDGRPMRSLDTGGDPLSKGLDAGIKFISKAFSLGERPKQAVDGPPANGGAQKLASSEGALTGQEYQQLTQTVDPEGKMTPGERNREIIKRVTEFGEKSGRQQEAAQLVGGVMLSQRRAVRVAGVMAEEALKKGDVEGATKILQKAYDAIPDGNTLVVEPAESGTGYVFKQVDGKGRTVAQGDLTPDVLKQQIELAKTGQAYDQHVYAAVQAGKGTQAIGASGKAVDPNETPATSGVKTAAGPRPASGDELTPEELADLPPNPGPRPQMLPSDYEGMSDKNILKFQTAFERNYVAPWKEQMAVYQKALKELRMRKRDRAYDEQKRIDERGYTERKAKEEATKRDAVERARIAAERRKDPKLRAEDELAAVDENGERIAQSGVMGATTSTGIRPEAAAVETTRRAIEPELNTQRADIGWNSREERDRETFDVRKKELSDGLDAYLNTGAADKSGKIDTSKVKKVDEMQRERLIDIADRMSERNNMNPRTLMGIVHEMGMGAGGNIRVNPRTGEVLVDGGRQRVFIDRQTMQQLALMRADTERSRRETQVSQENANAATSAAARRGEFERQVLEPLEKLKVSDPSWTPSRKGRNNLQRDQFNEERRRLGIPEIEAR